jgi:hypothetical protein
MFRSCVSTKVLTSVSCWARSPQKITVVARLKSGRKVTIVTGVVTFGTAVNSMKLTNPVTLKMGLLDRNVPRKATSATAEEAEEKHGHDTSHGAPRGNQVLNPKKLFASALS